MSTTTTISHPDGTTITCATSSTQASGSGSGALGQLIYFPVYAKGLQLAMIAEMSGLKWEGKTTEGDGANSWASIKATGVAPFGQMPLLKTSGGRVVAQSTAIANYIARKGGMEGNTDDDFIMSQMCMAEGEDIFKLIFGAELAFWKTPEVRAAKAEEQKKVFTEDIPAHLANLEKLCGASGFTSTGETAGEIYLFGMIYQATVAGGAGLVDAFPNLKAWFNTIAAKAAIKKVIAGEAGAPGSFKLKPYFLSDELYAAQK
jgi:glutathione S-transferase